MNKLSLTNFYDVYGIELLSHQYQIDKSWLLVLILPIAEKYLKYTLMACQHEAFYFDYESSEKNDYLFNKWKLDKLSIKKYTLLQCYEWFHDGDWFDFEYGGESWAEIAKTGINLQKAINEKNLRNIILNIDRLNQLEHNNDFYLSDYTDFDLYSELAFKFSNDDEEEIFLRCSNDVKKLWREYK